MSTDVTYEAECGLTGITIDRPERRDAFRARTAGALVPAFNRAWVSPGFSACCGN